MLLRRDAQPLQVTRVLAGGLVCLYLILAVAASLCIFGHASSGSGAHHHSQNVSHSVLCVWACQATSTALAVKVEFSSAPMLIALGLLLPWLVSRSHRFAGRIAARAPPAF